MLTSSIPWLSLSIWTPILLGLALIGFGRPLQAGSPSLLRQLALGASVLSLLPTIVLITDFNAAHAGFQFVEKFSWIERFSVNYFLGVDGLSVWFVPLTALITIFVVVAGWEVIEDRPAVYMGSFLI
ncbi:MAG: NADH-quinone oxidoreductase subunit M, partial [Betaproteobacteria bacterium]|nr:NADH-quinone oxidoreductase subunit M [Betaproteobacteria bacterium]